jgi:hypothetical protein
MFKIKVEERADEIKDIMDNDGDLSPIYTEITKDIHDALIENIPDLNITELRDLISGYGKFRELSKDDVVRAIAEIKNQQRLDAKVEATERGDLPLRNGLERAKQAQKTREKNAQILKNIKDKGIEPILTEADKAAAYATATDAHHRRIENAISDIEKEIAENKRKQKSEPKKYTDERSKELESDLAKLKEIRDAKFKEPLKTELEKLVSKAKKLTEDIGKAVKAKDKKTEEQLQAERELTDGQITNLKAKLKEIKTAEQKKLENLQDKLDKLIQGEITETKDRVEDSPEAKSLKEQIEKQKELMGLKPSKSTPSDNAINAVKKAIDGLKKQIENLENGNLEDGTPIKIISRDGTKLFGIGKEKAAKVNSQRLRELQGLKEGLEAEINDLLPQNIKDQAVLTKVKENRQRRLDFLNTKIEKGKYDPTVFDVKKRQPITIISKDGKVISIQKIIEDNNLKIKKAEKELDRVQEEWRLSQRSALEKFGDLMNNIAREGAISNPTAIPKIFSSGILTQLARPFENLIGVPAIYGLPKSVRENASIEGKFSSSIEAKAYKQFANSDNWKQAWEKMKTGKHREDVLYGDKNYPEQLVSIKNPINGKTYKINFAVSGRMHAFAKTVPYRMGYQRSRMYAYQDAILKHPEYFDSEGVLTPHGQATIESQAYFHSLGDAFLQNNKLSQWVRNKISELQRSKEKSDRVKAFALNNIFKVLNVSANYFSAGLDYTPLIGQVRAQFAARSSVEMTPERANKIARQNKRGYVGLAMFAIGAAAPSIFGGYGKYDDENEEGVKTGEVKVGNLQLPHWLTHTPFLVPLQLGATYGNYLRESEDKKDAVESFKEATKGVIETNPFAYTFQTFTGALEGKKKFNQFVFDEAFGQWIPYSAAVRKIGEWNDKDINGNVNKRVPNDNTIIEGFEDRMKIATGFRSGVPLKKETKKSKDVELK